MYVKMRSNPRAEHSGIGCLIILIATLLINITIGGCCLQYTTQEWMSSIKGKRVHTAFWKCGLAAIPLGEVAIPAAIITLMINPASDIKEDDKQ